MNQNNMGKFKLHCVFGSAATRLADEDFKSGVEYAKNTEGDYQVFEFDTLVDMHTAMDMIGAYDGWNGYFFKTETPNGKYYHPVRLKGEDPNINQPCLRLHNWYVFTSPEVCIEWLKTHRYDPNDFVIHECSGDDMDYYSIIR